MLYIVVKGGVFMDWVQVVSTIGFPIAMCGALCWFIVKTMTALTAAINGLSDEIHDLIKNQEKR